MLRHIIRFILLAVLLFGGYFVFRSLYTKLYGDEVCGVILENNYESRIGKSDQRRIFFGYHIGNKGYVEASLLPGSSEFEVFENVVIKVDPNNSMYSSISEATMSCPPIDDSLLIYGIVPFVESYYLKAKLNGINATLYHFPTGSFFFVLDGKQKNTITFEVDDKVSKHLIVEPTFSPDFKVINLALNFTDGTGIDTMHMAYDQNKGIYTRMP